jgi:glycosyltransferase involved in cell wall biosynthesis
MLTDPPPAVALYYDPDGYVEQIGRPARRGVGAPVGLMGRQVAGRAFLDAYLTFGRWDELTAVVRARPRATPLIRLCHDHPSSRTRKRRLRLIEEADYPAQLAGPTPPARLLHTPCPPDERLAWLRQAAAPGQFALCGVTHTLASPAAVSALNALVTAPFEPYDALVCTSRAVADMVRAVTGHYADYLRDRFGGNPAVRARLVTIPLGIDPSAFHPPTSDERAAGRQELGVTDDEVLVLCVGRLSHHAKAHPFPLFVAAREAARRTGRRIHLMLAGWVAHPTVAAAYRAGADAWAPGVRVTFPDGQSPAVRKTVWPAADVFASLPDNVQETFGLVVVEAMASRLPVLASDWDGYRDLVVPGETGFLVPTRMVRGATIRATTRLLSGQESYDEFLAECSQATTVDASAAADALTRLVADADLRSRLGAAGRTRAVEHFRWERVIRAYEDLWAEQLSDLATASPARPTVGPARYPAPEVTFAAYPTAWLDDGNTVRAADGVQSALDALLGLSLTTHVAERRCADRATIEALLTAAAARRVTVGDLGDTLEKSGTSPEAARATLAWLLKYGLLVAESAR